MEGPQRKVFKLIQIPALWPFPGKDGPKPPVVISARRATKVNPLEDREARHLGHAIRIGT